MITDQDRSGWFGASDTHYIMSNWNTKSWNDWWQVKLGLATGFPSNMYMEAGNFYEHGILALLDIPNMELDKQVRIEELRLRVNLDGCTDDTIYEVKTYKATRNFKVSKSYYQQVQVQMYATGLRKAKIVAYPLFEEDYLYPDYLNLEKELVEIYEIEYDEEFISEYLTRLSILRDYLIEEMEEMEVI